MPKSFFRLSYGPPLVEKNPWQFLSLQLNLHKVHIMGISKNFKSSKLPSVLFADFGCDFGKSFCSYGEWWRTFVRIPLTGKRARWRELTNKDFKFESYRDLHFKIIWWKTWLKCDREYWLWWRPVAAPLVLVVFLVKSLVWPPGVLCTVSSLKNSIALHTLQHLPDYNDLIWLTLRPDRYTSNEHTFNIEITRNFGLNNVNQYPLFASNRSSLFEQNSQHDPRNRL